MPNVLETSWMTLEINDIPLSLCSDLGKPNLGMISWSSFFFFVCLFVCLFYHVLNLLSSGGKIFNPSCECIYHD